MIVLRLGQPYLVFRLSVNEAELVPRTRNITVTTFLSRHIKM